MATVQDWNLDASLSEKTLGIGRLKVLLQKHGTKGKYDTILHMVRDCTAFKVHEYA